MGGRVSVDGGLGRGARFLIELGIEPGGALAARKARVRMLVAGDSGAANDVDERLPPAARAVRAV
jgi:hypothetical protein